MNQILVPLFALMSVAIAANAQTTHRVPEDFSTIQDAVDACSQGDIVEINGGEWTGSGFGPVVRVGTSITIRSRPGTRAVISGENIRSALVADAPDVRLEGLDLREGGEPERSYCLFHDSGRLSLEDCRLFGSSTAGIFAVGKSLELRRCEFSGFRATGVYVGYDGPALSTEGIEDYVLIEACTFEDCFGEEGGGGIEFEFDSGSSDYDVLVTNSTFRGCRTTELGGAVLVDNKTSAEPSGHIRFANCTFASNQSDLDGGAIHTNCAIELEDCVFTGNLAGRNGGGLACVDTDEEVLLTRTSFEANQADNGGGAVAVNDARLASNSSFFAGNSSQFGGAIRAAFSTFGFSDSRFLDNVAYIRGGALDLIGTSGVTAECVLASNFAALGAGGIHATSVSGVVSSETIFCENTSGLEPQNHIYFDLTSTWIDSGGNSFAPTCDAACPTDLDGDGVTGGSDLGLFFVDWGACKQCPADFNSDGSVDGIDLGLLFADWGECP